MSHLWDHLRTIARFTETLHHCHRRFSLAFHVLPYRLLELWVPGKPMKWIILSKACRRPKGWMMRCTMISALLSSWGRGWKTRMASKSAKLSKLGSDFQSEPFWSRLSPSKICWGLEGTCLTLIPGWVRLEISRSFWIRPDFVPPFWTRHL